MTVSPRGVEPAVLVGPAALTDAIAGFEGPAVAVVDRVVGETEIGRAAVAHLRSQPRFQDVALVDEPATVPGLVEAADRRRGTRLVVGIGGGAVIDRVKLLAGLHRRTDTARFLAVPQRAGWTSLRAERERDVGLVVMPTTLGTGAEMSRVACLDGRDGKRLVEGALLRADAAVLDARVTATLPGLLVMEGVLEAWSRVLGALAGAPSAAPSEDALAREIAARLTQLGFQARDALAAGRAPDAELRHEVARLSAMSHSHWLHLGRPPFAYKTWFLATELASHAAVRKVPALAAVLPPVWAEILSGSGVLGDRVALVRAWEAVTRGADVGLAEDPLTGLCDLLRAWQPAERFEEPALRVDPDAVARSAMRRWSAGLPMLGEADGRLLHRIFASCARVPTGARANEDV